jgi:curved DNA-binding protein CbpA
VLIVERSEAMRRKADHFELLGITQEMPPDQVRRAYFELARQLHPDRIVALGLGDIRAEAQRLFAEINAAFAVLSNPKQRAEYVQTLAAGGVEVVKRKQEEAEAIAQRLLDAETEFRTGEMALRRNQVEVAVGAFKRAVELNPDEGEHHALFAWTSWVVATDKAAAAKLSRAGLDKAVQLSPKSPIPHLYLGKIARSSGDDAGAAAHFRRALELSPGHGDAASELRVLEARNPKLRRT